MTIRRKLAAVFAGGFCGTLLRYGLSLFVQAQLGKQWPYDILLINLTGAFLLAFLNTLATTLPATTLTMRLFLTVGLLGAYTTFSSLALGDILLFQTGQWLPATLYLLFSLCGGIVAVAAGAWCGRSFLWALKR